MATGVPADPSLGPTPGEAMRSSSSAAKQEDDGMQAAIQVRLMCDLLRVPCILVDAIPGQSESFRKLAADQKGTMTCRQPLR